MFNFASVIWTTQPLRCLACGHRATAVLWSQYQLRYSPRCGPCLSLILFPIGLIEGSHQCVPPALSARGGNARRAEKAQSAGSVSRIGRCGDSGGANVHHAQKAVIIMARINQSPLHALLTPLKAPMAFVISHK